MRKILLLVIMALLLTSTWMAMTVGRISGPVGRTETILRDMNQFDWVVFTSPESVDLVMERLAAIEMDVQVLKDAKTAAMDKLTAEKLQAAGIVADVLSETGTSEGLLEKLRAAGVDNVRVLIAGEEWDEWWLAGDLKEAGAAKVVEVVYDSAVRNILFAHVPSSICSLLCFTVLMIASVGYLRTDKPGWDMLAAASGEVGFVLVTVLNATGMIFARAEWNVWWVASPRLISSAILWFLAIVYLILRTSVPGSLHHRARICAVFGIIAFLDVPMVYISARFIPDAAHKANFEFGSNEQRVAFVLSIIAVNLLAAMLIWLRTDVLRAKAELERTS